MGRLEDLIGTEADLARLSGTVQEVARTMRASAVGAYHVACSDEAEWECVESFLILSCVTINRPGPNTELLVGRHEIDWTGETPTTGYDGLGDDPARYRIEHEQGRLCVQDGGQ